MPYILPGIVYANCKLIVFIFEAFQRLNLKFNDNFIMFIIH